ncbi:MAG: helix-turn-helix transcriptional regulator [Candidatus Binatia bacterium]
MSKAPLQALSLYARDAAVLLGQLIRRARIERRLTTAQLAERAGVSRGLVQRIERGDPGCAIGRVFECAAIVGVRLFDLDRIALEDAVDAGRRTLTLMPKSVRAARDEGDDDF